MRVTTYIIAAKKSKNLSVLNNLQRSRDNKDEVSDALTLSDDKVTRSTMCHLEIGGQRSETPVTSQSEGWMTVKHSSKGKVI